MSFTSTVLTLVSLCCLGTVSSSLLTVLETTSDLALFDPHTGAQLDNSSTLGHNKVTLCARFLNYQFATHIKDDWQSLLGWGKQGIGSHWQDSDLTGSVYLGGVSRFPIWDIEVWNHICILIDLDLKVLKTVMNGKTVVNQPLKSDLSILDNSLTLMGYPTTNGYDNSLFGRMTDVNMWSRWIFFYLIFVTL